MNSGLKYSIIMHLFFVVSSFLYISKSNPVLSTERIITVDLVNVRPAANTNLKNTAITSKKSKIRKAKPPKKPTIVKKTKAAKILRKQKTSHQKKPTLSPKKQVAKDEIKINRNRDIDQVLDELEEDLASKNNLESQATQSNTGTKNLAKSDKPYNPSLPLTIAERDNIKMQIERKFFNPIVSDFSSGEIIIKIKLDMDPNGEIRRIMVLNSSYYAARHSDAFVALRDSLIRAAHMASPLRGLDKQRYEGRNGWKEIELIFDAYYLMHA